MEIYIIPKTKKVLTKKEFQNLYNEMCDNGVEFLDKINLPYSGRMINQRLWSYTYRYKNGNKVTELIIEKIIV